MSTDGPYGKGERLNSVGALVRQLDIRSTTGLKGVPVGVGEGPSGGVLEGARVVGVDKLSRCWEKGGLERDE